MKPKLRNSLTAVLLAATTAFVHTATAADFFWDGTAANIATDGNGASNPASNGVWNTTTLNWDVGASPHVAWSNDGTNTAVFAGTARTVTSSGTINLTKLDIRTTSYIFAGGTLNFSGGTIDVNNTRTTGSANGFTTTTLSGSVVLNATGNTNNSANFISTISSDNAGLTSFELNTNQNANQLGIFNAGALGPNGSTVKLTKGLLGLSTAAPTTYNSWVTELAGGTIRTRVAGVSTYSGNATLTANSALATANLANAALAYSGTIALGTHTLSISPGNASGNAISINNTISGAGSINITGDATNFGSSGGGLATLGVANAFSGIATTSLGTLALGNVNALQNATLNTGSNGTQSVTFTVAGTNTYNIGALQGSDDLAIGDNTISVGSKDGNTTFAAIISGAGGLTKVGSNSSLTLSVSSAYNGPTAVNAGALIIDGSTASGSAVTVAGGATLGGTGTVGGSATFDNTSVFGWGLSVADPTNTASANVPDTFVVTGDLVDGGAVGGSIFKITLDGTQTFSDNFWSTNQSWSSVVTSGNSLALETLFTGFSFENASGAITLDALTRGSFTLTGNNLAFTAVPEPSTMLAGLLLGAGVLRRRRGV